MAFRTVLIEKAKKINLDLNNIVIYYEDEPFWINLDEISTIIIEDPRCLVSLKLLTEICEKGITFILTNSSHMPIGAINTLLNHSRASKKLKQQISWQKETKDYLWTKIVEAKIKGQMQTLEILQLEEKLYILKNLINTIETADSTNREGIASRTYFKELFGKEFKRFNEDIINFCLNYVYQIIRSKIAQEIVNLGYNPELGLNHCSELNSYNLADDFIEVYRPIVDYYVYTIIKDSDDEYLTPNIKTKLVNILNQRILYKNVSQKISNSITLYIQDMFNFLETGDIDKIVFPELIWII